MLLLRLKAARNLTVPCGLTPETMAAARSHAPGWDVYQLESEWRAWVAAKGMVSKIRIRHVQFLPEAGLNEITRVPIVAALWNGAGHCHQERNYSAHISARMTRIASKVSNARLKPVPGRLSPRRRGKFAVAVAEAKLVMLHLDGAPFSQLDDNARGGQRQGTGGSFIAQKVPTISPEVPRLDLDLVDMTVRIGEVAPAKRLR